MTDVHPTSVNSIYNAIGYNSAPILTLTPSAPILDQVRQSYGHYPRLEGQGRSSTVNYSTQQAHRRYNLTY